jgi:hypothetical protein
MKNETVKQPTQNVYESLQKKYPDTLQCPCRKISIPYEDFVDIEPRFHQVCSSDFITQIWIDFAFNINSTLIWPIDIRRSLTAMWRLVATFCQMSMNTTISSLNQFGNR